MAAASFFFFGRKRYSEQPETAPNKKARHYCQAFSFYFESY
jgi:hypothetical protein